MNIVQPYFLIGAALSLVYGALLLFGALRSRKARIRFGDEPRVDSLVTYDASKRRAWKGIFMMLATALVAGVTVVEDTGAIAALPRSAELTKDVRLPILVS